MKYRHFTGGKHLEYHSFSINHCFMMYSSCQLSVIWYWMGHEYVSHQNKLKLNQLMESCMPHWSKWKFLLERQLLEFTYWVLFLLNTLTPRQNGWNLQTRFSFKIFTSKRTVVFSLCGSRSMSPTHWNIGFGSGLTNRQRSKNESVWEIVKIFIMYVTTSI